MQIKLVMFDLEAGRPTWESRVFHGDSTELTSHDIVYGRDHYVVY